MPKQYMQLTIVDLNAVPSEHRMIMVLLTASPITIIAYSNFAALLLNQYQV
jgi:hypothetical protein